MVRLFTIGLLLLASGAQTAHGASISFFVSNENAATYDQYSGSGQFLQSLVPAISFHIPYGTVADSSGHLYVSDVGASRIVEFSQTGAELAVLQTPVDNSGLSPEGLAFDPQGNLYVTSFNGNIIRFAGGSGTGTVIGSVPGARTGIVYNPADGLLYVSTSTNGGDIFTLPATGGAATLWAHAPGGAFPGSNLRDLALFGGDIYLADATWDGEGAIYRFHAGSSTPNLIVSGLCGADYVQLDSAGNLYVAEYCGDRISKFGADGSPLGVVVSGLHGPGSFALVETPDAPEPATFSLAVSALAACFLTLRNRGRQG